LGHAAEDVDDLYSSKKPANTEVKLRVQAIKSK
jgi:hypothetical protein